MWGSIFIGLGIGLFRHVVAKTHERSAYGQTVAFFIFTAICFILCTPILNYRELEKDILRTGGVPEHKSGKIIVFLTVNSFLAIIGFISSINAI